MTGKTDIILTDEQREEAIATIRRDVRAHFAEGHVEEINADRNVADELYDVRCEYLDEDAYRAEYGVDAEYRLSQEWRRIVGTFRTAHRDECLETVLEAVDEEVGLTDELLAEVIEHRRLLVEFWLADAHIDLPPSSWLGSEEFCEYVKENAEYPAN